MRPSRPLSQTVECALRVRAFGARVEPLLPAHQIVWLRLANGLWRGICRMRVDSANHLSTATNMLGVPPEAITVHEEDNT